MQSRHGMRCDAAAQGVAAHATASPLRGGMQPPRTKHTAGQVGPRDILAKKGAQPSGSDLFQHAPRLSLPAALHRRCPPSACCATSVRLPCLLIRHVPLRVAHGVLLASPSGAGWLLARQGFNGQLHSLAPAGRLGLCLVGPRLTGFCAWFLDIRYVFS